MDRKTVSWIVSVAVAAACAAPAAWSDHRGRGRFETKELRRTSDFDYARVVDVDPIMHRFRVSEPRRECFQETRYEPSEPDRGYDYRARDTHSAAGPMILGGVLGAAVGSQIGSGDGRRAATVAGAVIGTAIGHDVAARRAARSGADRYAATAYERAAYVVERCEVRYEQRWEERVEAYDVTYRYRGREYRTRMPYDPGPQLRVRVDVRPERAWVAGTP
jgi:uncharacterized protein YcfJ